MIVYAAKHLLPVASAPIQNGAIAVHDGWIAAVGRRKDVVKAHPGVEVRDLGETVIIPGLINAHTHIELSFMNGDPPAGGTFITWIADLVTRRERVSAEESVRAATAAIETMVQRGTVAVGDIANGTWAAPLLARSGLHGLAFHELFGFGAAGAESILDAAAQRLEAIEGAPEVAGAPVDSGPLPLPGSPALRRGTEAICGPDGRTRWPNISPNIFCIWLSCPSLWLL